MYHVYIYINTFGWIIRIHRPEFPWNQINVPKVYILTLINIYKSLTFLVISCDTLLSTQDTFRCSFRFSRCSFQSNQNRNESICPNWLSPPILRESSKKKTCVFSMIMMPWNRRICWVASVPGKGFVLTQKAWSRSSQIKTSPDTLT